MKIKEWIINDKLKKFFGLEKALSLDFVFDNNKIQEKKYPFVETNTLSMLCTVISPEQCLKCSKSSSNKHCMDERFVHTA